MPLDRHVPVHRPCRVAVLLVSLVVLLAACTGSDAKPAASGSSSSSAGGSADPAKAAAVTSVVQEVMASQHLRAVIVKVTIDGKDVITKAWGDSMPGVPATPAMHFRNGAVSIAYMSTLLLQLVDQGKVKLDDKVSTWLPDIPYTNQVTLRQLAQMTSGYVDYVSTDELAQQQYADPFKQWTPQEQIAISTKHPLLYPPGTNWNYSHTNYVILGLALEKITGKPLSDALRDSVLKPLGLNDTNDPGTPAIPEPVLHAYSSERRGQLGIPDTTPFTEDSTFWNPSWTLARGAIESTTIDDLNTTAIAIGTGKLLKPDSYKAMTTKELIGKTTKLDGCTTCGPQSEGYTYGLGLVSSGDWVLQNPLFAGEGGAFAYEPSSKIAISVAVTFEPEDFPASNGYQPKNSADYLWRRIGAVLGPTQAPLIR